MRRAFRFLSALAISIGTVADAAPAPLVLTHVTVINVTGGMSQRDLSVVIAGCRIVAVGPAARTKPPKGEQIIEAGKTADLVLLDANPQENSTNTRKISAVIRGGKYFDRAALDNLLAQAKAAPAAVE